MIVCSVRMQEPFISKQLVESFKIPSFKVFIDLSVPRSIETSLEELAGVVLYNVDNTDPENPVYTPLDGWHVNLRVGDYDPALDAFKVNPEPLVWRRMWL